MSKTEYGVNMSDKHLVVGSIEVLGDISGNGIKTIKQQIDAVEQRQAFTPEPVNYWSELISDGVISPLEKKTLKQQWEEIASIYAQLLLEAQEQEKTTETVWASYESSYYYLYNYLFTSLKLFDDMTTSTTVSDREAFNEYFSNYYANQSAAQILLTQGEPGRIRSLSNLHEAGTDGEVAMYNNWFYVYSEKYQQWNSVPKDEYLGACSTPPSSRAKNQYFLATKNMKTTSDLLMVNKKVLLVDNKAMIVSYYATKGNIYVWNGKKWELDADKNSYRYFVATNDLVTNGEAISPVLEETIKGVSGTSGYLGMFITDPDNPKFNEYYVYIGETTDTRTNGSIYMYTYNGWKVLDPTDPDNYSYYMKTLKDTLANTSVQVGAFSSLFCSVLAANQAFITSLFTQQITLMQNGYIQSNGYDGTKGFRLNANGKMELNELTAILGGNNDQSIALKSSNWLSDQSPSGFAILKNGEAFFQNAHIKGEVNATSGTFKNGEFENVKITGNSELTDVNIKGDSKFEGEIDSGPLKLSNAGTFVTYTITEGTRSDRINVSGITGTYNEQTFESYSLWGSQTDVTTSTSLDLKSGYSDVTSYLKLGDIETISKTLRYTWTVPRGAGPGKQQYAYPITFSYNKAQPDTKTFKLLDLPTIDPAEVGRVWRDGSLLKISLG